MFSAAQSQGDADRIRWGVGQRLAFPIITEERNVWLIEGI
jgi:hypothetical protein